MSSFPLKIVTPDGLQYDGPAKKLVVRTTSGDIAILRGHINYVAPLGMGEAAVTVDGETRYAACIGGMVSVVDGTVTLLPTTFEWANQIDVERAERSRQRAEQVLARQDGEDKELLLAKARLRRALIRENIAARNKE